MAKSFASPEAESRFFAAYDEVLAQWPVPVTSLDLVSQFGNTHVQACGPDDAPSLILLSGGGATSTVWFNNVKAFSRDHRVYAVDLLGDAGRGRPGGRRIDHPDVLMAWLDSVLDRLGLLGAALVGHSYGGQVALNYALHAPHRVRSLALLDPTACFAGMSPGYLLRAAPVLLRPSAGRMRSLIRWETRGDDVDPAWLRLVSLGRDSTAEFPKSKVIVHRPEPERLAASTVPTLLLLAERSRAHNIATVARDAHKLMPRLLIKTLAGVSHHGLPIVNADATNRAVLDFVG
jgi:pimeloyl-ACP methyl ester carboxylesterase